MQNSFNILLIVAFVIILFILRKIRQFEINSQQNNKDFNTTDSRSIWNGFEGKILWDAMTGRVTGPSVLIENIRKNYEKALVNHITEIYQLGKADGERGIYRPPPNSRVVITYVGAVMSWIPFNHANTIYRCGTIIGKKDEHQIAYCAREIDDSSSYLFSMTKIFREIPMSKILDIPIPPPQNTNYLEQEIDKENAARIENKE